MLSNASSMFTRFSFPVLDDFTDQDMKNIERIFKNVLMTAKSREQQKALVKKYLRWVSRQLKRKTSCFFQVISDKIRKSLNTWKMDSKVRPSENRCDKFGKKSDFSSNQDCLTVLSDQPGFISFVFQILLLISYLDLVLLFRYIL